MGGIILDIIYNSNLHNTWYFSSHNLFCALPVYNASLRLTFGWVWCWNWLYVQRTNIFIIQKRRHWPNGAWICPPSPTSTNGKWQRLSYPTSLWIYNSPYSVKLRTRTNRNFSIQSERKFSHSHSVQVNGWTQHRAQVLRPFSFSKMNILNFTKEQNFTIRKIFQLSKASGDWKCTGSQATKSSQLSRTVNWNSRSSNWNFN